MKLFLFHHLDSVPCYLSYIHNSINTNWRTTSESGELCELDLICVHASHVLINNILLI